MALQRFVFGPDPKLSGMPYLILLYLGRIVTKRSKAQGYGLHSQEEGFYFKILFLIKIIVIMIVV
jgi:hypothetical protein